MKIKNVVFGLFIVLLLMGVIRQGCQKADEMENCVEEKKEIWKGTYDRGYIFIEFQENVTEDEIMVFLDSYNLQINNSFRFQFPEVAVNVPSGHEIEWMCKLEKNSIVKGVYLNIIGGTPR